MVQALCDMNFENRHHMEDVSFRLELIDNNIFVILSILFGHGFGFPLVDIINHNTIIVQDDIPS